MTLIADRIVEVKVGPQGQIGRVWRDLFVRFSVEQVSGSSPNKATIDLFNLADESLQYLESPELSLQILAGTKTAGQVFFGDISRQSVETTWAAPDWKTTIKAADGRRVFRETKFSRSYPSQTTRSQIVTDVLATMGIPRGFIDPDIPEKTFPASLLFSAPARSVLDELYNPDGAVWSIQGGALQVVAAGKPAKRQAIVISSDTGMIGTPKRNNKGIEVTTDLDGSIQPGAVIILKSFVVSGQYRVVKSRHQGDTFGDQWQTTATGVAY